MLSDPGSETIKRYGILNTVVYEALEPGGDHPALQADVARYVAPRVGEALAGIAFPGTFMLDPQGRVTDRFFEDSYRDRYTAANILLQLGVGGSSVTATEMSTHHVRIRTYPSDGEVALGDRFSLVVEIEPLPEMHVYAPGAARYRVVDLRIDPQQSVRLYPIEYPPSEIYHFEPLDERVPVYQRPFTLLQEVAPEVDREHFEGKDTLTLTGSLEYQACDHSICYNPVSVPLSWTVGLKPFVSGQ